MVTKNCESELYGLRLVICRRVTPVEESRADSFSWRARKNGGVQDGRYGKFWTKLSAIRTSFQPLEELFHGATLHDHDFVTGAAQRGVTLLHCIIGLLNAPAA